MTFSAPIDAGTAVQSAEEARAVLHAALATSQPGNRTEFRRLRIGFDALARCTADRMRADKAYMTKTRLAWRIPYHEWEEALDLGDRHMAALLSAYAPRYMGEPDRVVAWKPRRYRGGEARHPWELGTIAPFRTTGGRRPRVWSI